MSEMCLDTAWWVIKSIGETPMKEYWALLISWFLFSKLPWIGHKVPYSRVSVGCQEGARGCHLFQFLSFGKVFGFGKLFKQSNVLVVKIARFGVGC